MFSTRIFKTPAGADVRIDTMPCVGMKAPDGTWPPSLMRDGSPCGEKKRIYLRYRNLSGKVERAVIWLCKHKSEEILEKYPNAALWNEEMNVALADELQRQSGIESASETWGWKEIHKRMCDRFPGFPFRQYEKPERRPGKGQSKEYRCSARSHHKDVFGTATCADTVWDQSVKRTDANKTIVRLKESKEPEARFEAQQDFDAALCACGHEIGAHNSYGKCPVCDKVCETAAPLENRKLNDYKRLLGI